MMEEPGGTGNLAAAAEEDRGRQTAGMLEVSRMPKKGRRSGRDEPLGADPGGLGGDEDYDWIRYLGEGSSSRSAASAGSSAATSGTTSTALQSQARTVSPARARSATALPATALPATALPATARSATARSATARPVAESPAAQPRQFGQDADQHSDGDTDPGGGPVGRGGAGTGRGARGRRAAGRRAEPSAAYEPRAHEPASYEPPSYQPQSYEPQPYEPPSYQPQPYEPQSYEPQSCEPGPARRFGRRDRTDGTSGWDRYDQSGRPAAGDGPGRGGTGPLPAAGRAARGEPSGRPVERGGDGSVQPSRSPSGTGPRRAVKVRQGRTTDLLFNPAAEDYGQPLYPPEDYGQRAGNAAGTLGTPARTPERQQDDRFTSPQRRLDTSEFAKPLYPALDAGPATDARPRRSKPGADPLGDTDARGRTPPADRRLARSRRGSRAAPALPGPDRTGPQRRIDDLSGAGPRTTGPQRRVDELGGAEPLTGVRRGERTGPQRRVDELGGADPPTGVRRGERTGPQRRVDGLSRPDPLTDSGIGVLWESEPAAASAGVAPDEAITKAPARPTGTGPFDRPAFDMADPLAEPADLPGTAPRGKPARTPRKGATKKTAASKPKPVTGRPRPRRRKKAMALFGGLVIVAALAAVGYFKLMPRTSHTVSAPAALGSYVKQQANATAKNLRHRIMVAAAGDVKNVVAAVYEQKKGPGTSRGPQIVVFIGGNLTGNASAGDLISAYMTRLHGAFTTMPGRLGGQAACAPGSDGGPSECAWADGDTFGVVVSATLSATGLADEMRQMRPLVEHVAK